MLKKNLLYNALLSISSFIFPLITFPYSSRILGPSGIGSVNFIDSFTQYFLIFSTLGIPVYGVREMSIRKNDPVELNKVFNEILLIHIISGCFYSVIFFLAALVIPALHAQMNLVLIGIVNVMFNIFLLEWFYQGIEKFSYITIRSLIVRTLTVIFLFAFLKPGSSSTVYYAISTSGLVLGAILNVIFLRPIVKIQPIYLTFKRHLKPLFIILGSSLAISVYLLLDTIILGFLKDPSAVGMYATAIKIVKLPFVVIVAISVVIIPKVSRAFSEKDHISFNSLIDKSFTLICLLCLPISVGMYISSPFLVHLFAGDKFSGAVLPLQILSPIIMLVGFSNILGFQILTPIGKEKQFLYAVIVGMVFSITLNLCIIPLLSYTGAAITNLTTEALVTYVCYYFVKKNMEIRFNAKLFLRCLLGALIFLPITFLIRLSNLNYIFKETSIMICCSLFYSLYVWFFIKNEYLKNLKYIISSKTAHIFKTNS